MKDLNVVVQSIVMHQELVLGPLAIERANTVDGLHVDQSGKVKITLKKQHSSSDLLKNLVVSYEKIFGQTSVEVCKDAIKESGVKLPADELPEILR